MAKRTKITAWESDNWTECNTRFDIKHPITGETVYDSSPAEIRTMMIDCGIQDFYLQVEASKYNWLPLSLLFNLVLILWLASYY